MGSTGKRKAGYIEDNNDEEKREEKVVVGRYTFNRYMKIQANERNIKIDNEFRKIAAMEWHKLERTEKAKFYVPSLQASNANTKDKEDISQSDETPNNNEEVPKCSVTFLTRCSPQRFHDVVSQFTKDQMDAIKEMGFGSLVQLSCTRLNREFCCKLIDNFDTETCILKLHGKTRKLDSSDFEQIMCVPEGGTNLDFRGSIEDEDVKPLREFYFGTSEHTSIAGLIKKLEEAKTADDNFKVGFMLLVLGTLLCPNTSLSIHSKYLIPLRDPKKINLLNWASYLFKFLVDGVRLFKSKNSRYLCGCVLFFLLYYKNSTAYGRTIIDCSMPVVAAWEDEKSKKLLKWVKRKGGLESSKVGLVSTTDGVMVTKHRVEDVFHVKEEMGLLKSAIIRIEKSIEEIRNVIIGSVLTKNVEDLKEGINYNTVKEEEEVDTGKQNEDTFTNQTDNGYKQSPNKTSSCQIVSPSQYIEDKRPQVDINNIKEEMMSPDFSPDPLLAYGDKIDQLTAQLLVDKPIGIQNVGPFRGCRDLSHEDVDLLAFIYITIWAENFVVFETINETVTREEIRCLEPEKLISNFVINAALSTIRKPKSSKWYCTTFFSVRAIQAAKVGGNALSEFGIHARKRFEPIFGSDKLMDCHMIFIPILDEETQPKHWFLMIVNIVVTDVEIWDTYPGTRTEARTNLVHHVMWALDAIFEAEISESFTTKWSFCSFRVRHPYYVPKQQNGFDCGMYMLKIIMDYENARNIGDELDSVNERVQLALWLLRHPNNLARAEIEKGMQQSDESPSKVKPREDPEESRGTSMNRNNKMKQLDEILYNVKQEGKQIKKVIKKLRVEPSQPAKKGRGRPPGSKNRPKPKPKPKK